MRSQDSGESAPRARAGSATGGKVGVGSHGGASPAEMHNTLIANGPSFHSGLNSELPSGNIDIAPTVIELLGLPMPNHFEGRVLHEALQNDNDGLGEASVFRRRSTSFAGVEEIFAGDTQYLCEFG